MVQWHGPWSIDKVYWHGLSIKSINLVHRYRRKPQCIHDAGFCIAFHGCFWVLISTKTERGEDRESERTVWKTRIFQLGFTWSKVRRPRYVCVPFLTIYRSCENLKNNFSCGLIQWVMWIVEIKYQCWVFRGGVRIITSILFMNSMMQKVLAESFSGVEV